MDTPNWIRYFVLFGLILLNHSIYGQSEVEVRLVVRKYVDKGSSVTLHCEHNVPSKILYKVTWLRDSTKKIFQFIKNRTPPYRNFTVPGAEIDWKNSNEEQLQLKNMDFDAAGPYHCEVSTDTPIFTKESNVEQVHVITQQTGPPRITFSKRQFSVGEHLNANCTSTKARPAPHITWLINGKKVDEKHIKTIHLHSANIGGNSNASGNIAPGKSAHRPKTHLQNNLSHDKYETIGTATHSHGRPGTPSMPSSDRNREEPLDANGNHMGFEIHQGSNYESERRSGGGAGGSHNSNRNSNSHHNKHNYNSNGFYLADGSGINMEASDYTEEKYFETSGSSSSSVSANKKHRNTYHTHRKYRRHSNELTGSGANNRHHLMASSSQLSIEVSELHASNNGRLEITCLATIPAHVGVGEQFADYKTYSVKIDIEQVEQTTVLPAMSSDMAALGNSSKRQTDSASCLTSLSLPIIIIVLINFQRLAEL